MKNYNILLAIAIYKGEIHSWISDRQGLYTSSLRQNRKYVQYRKEICFQIFSFQPSHQILIICTQLYIAQSAGSGEYTDCISG